MAARSTRMSKTQKEHLVSFLEQNKFLLEVKPNPSELEKYKKTWEQLANELNTLPGARKSVKQWKDALNELKVSVRRKARLQHADVGRWNWRWSQEGEGFNRTRTRTRLLMLLSKIVITGAPTIPEAGISNFSDTVVLDSSAFENNVMFYEPLPSIPTYQFTDEASNVTVLEIQQPPKKLVKKRDSRKQPRIESIAKQHEECLQQLTAANTALAAATHQLAYAVKKRRRVSSAALNLRF